MSTSKKRSAVKLDTKKAIIEAAEKNNNKSELAKQFNIPRGTLMGILKEKDTVLKAIGEGSKAKRARLTTGKHEDMEASLIHWIKTVRSQNIPVTDDL